MFNDLATSPRLSTMTGKVISNITKMTMKHKVTILSLSTLFLGPIFAGVDLDDELEQDRDGTIHHFMPLINVFDDVDDGDMFRFMGQFWFFDVTEKRWKVINTSPKKDVAFQAAVQQEKQ